MHLNMVIQFPHSAHGTRMPKSAFLALCFHLNASLISVLYAVHEAKDPTKPSARLDIGQSACSVQALSGLMVV